MPTLHWIGKDKVLNHHLEVPFRTLNHEYTHGDSASGNRILHGDNLEALKALLPEYEGRVKCIYIDMSIFSFIQNLLKLKSLNSQGNLIQNRTANGTHFGEVLTGQQCGMNF